MILLSDNHLIFKLPNGESVLVSADTICVDFMGDSGGRFDTEFIRAAASAVFHYFKNDLNYDSVTLSEFSGALEKILRGFALEAAPAEPAAPDTEADLRLLAAEAGRTELLFYSRLRDEVPAGADHGVSAPLHAGRNRRVRPGGKMTLSRAAFAL